MAVWFVLIVPLAILFFALFMERVETRLRNGVVAEDEVKQFLEEAQPEEVRALYGHGIGHALELFRGRRGRNKRKQAHSRSVRLRPRKART